MARRTQARRAAAAEQTTTSNNGGSSSSGEVTDPNAGSPGNAPAPSGSAQVAVDTARAQLGKPYVYAGSGPDVFDCSGLTMYAWAAAGVSLSHNAEAQYMSLPHVSQSELQPGDLVFFGAPIHHVGIYVGGGTMIEAPYTGVDVRYHDLPPDYAGAPARRELWDHEHAELGFELRPRFWFPFRRAARARPLRTRPIIGMLCTPYSCASWGSSSMLTFTTL
jgi:cell wall-associated NlpC family hydrolase